MARTASGSIRERRGADGSVFRSLRFVAYGKRRHVALGQVSRADAERALAHTIADVQRGIWREAEPPPREPDGIPTFHEYAEQWWTRNEGHWRPAGRADYRWRLERHLLPYLGEHKLDEITFAVIENFIASKLAEADPLSARSINMLLVLAAQIFDSAVESELIARNPARGRRRRVREHAPARSFLDSADHLTALLDAAGQLDAGTNVMPGQRRALLATLAFAGLRIGEALALRWRDLDLARGTITVLASKTDAGLRTINVLPVLRDELLAYKARNSDAPPDMLIFGSSTGRQRDRSQARDFALAPAIKVAGEMLAAAGSAPLPSGLTHHSLRRTFASILYALGENPPYVMSQLGHTDPSLALTHYARVMSRRDGEADRLGALVRGADSALIGTRASDTAEANAEREAA
jgi:integrase